MKRIERRKLKENEFARTVAQARQTLESKRTAITRTAILLAVVAAIGLGFLWWRSARTADANARFAAALAVYERQVVPPPPPAPGSPPPVPQPGTFQSQEERLNASLPKFLEAANAHPGTRAGMTARYYAAGILAAMGRYAEAETEYQRVVDRASGTIYARTARLGLAEAQLAQGKYDQAIAIYTELSRETDSSLPLDGILLHLGRAYARAGKKEDATRTFNRVVDEFPQSAYAAEARRELEEARARS